MATIAVGKMVPGEPYTVDGQALTFVGIRNGSYDYTAPVKFGMALLGDRWVFQTSKGEQVLYKKGWNLKGKPGLVPADVDGLVRNLAKIAS